MEKCIAFLIDADNLNDPDAVEEAFESFHAQFGVSTLRRAYGSTDNLRGLSSVLKKHAVRLCTNFMLEKNTTDAALVTDAMEIACTLQPDVMAIGSGDADFFPLAVRLRERGVRVVAFSLNGKMSDEVLPAYDEVFFVGKPRVLISQVQTAVPARAAAAKKAPAKKVAAKKVAAKSVPAKKVAVKKVSAKKATPKQVAVDAGTTSAQVTLAQILRTIPALKAGLPVHLGEAAKLLHDEKLLGKSASSTKLFGKFPQDFELTPALQPNQVRWVQRA